MTSKEALEGLIDAYISWRAYQTRECIENDYRYKKLLKDLDRLEELEIENDELKRINGAYQESNIVFQDLIKKFKKAIEILKTKLKMEPHHLPKSRYYHFYIGSRMLLLTKQEYELLKEVLKE